MSEKLIIAADYLSYPEAVELYNILLDAGISSVVKNSGPPGFLFGEGIYHRILIQEEKIDEATPIIEEFRKRQEQAANLPYCPNCGSADVWPAQDVSLLKKIMYAGTTVYHCNSCGQEFPY